MQELVISYLGYGTNDRFLKASLKLCCNVTNDKGCEGYDEGILTVDSPEY